MTFSQSLVYFRPPVSTAPDSWKERQSCHVCLYPDRHTCRAWKHSQCSQQIFRSRIMFSSLISSFLYISHLLDVFWLLSVWLLMSLTLPSCQSRLNKSPERCRQGFALSQREQQQLCICLLVGDSIRTCGHAVANAEPRAGNQHCQSSSSSSSSTGEELCLRPAERNIRDRERGGFGYRVEDQDAVGRGCCGGNCR